MRWYPTPSTARTASQSFLADAGVRLSAGCGWSAANRRWWCPAPRLSRASGSVRDALAPFPMTVLGEAWPASGECFA